MFVRSHGWACSAVGSAPEWHSGGHRFDPGQVHHPSLRSVWSALSVLPACRGSLRPPRALPDPGQVHHLQTADSKQRKSNPNLRGWNRCRDGAVQPWPGLPGSPPRRALGAESDVRSRQQLLAGRYAYSGVSITVTGRAVVRSVRIHAFASSRGSRHRATSSERSESDCATTMSPVVGQPTNRPSAPPREVDDSHPVHQEPPESWQLMRRALGTARAGRRISAERLERGSCAHAEVARGVEEGGEAVGGGQR